MTSYSFLSGLEALDEAGWAKVEAAVAETAADLYEWDAAWNLVVALGLDGGAHPAMALAREAGRGARVGAFAGAAGAAVAVRGQIGERTFRNLYRPFQEVLPADPELAEHGFVDRLYSLCPVGLAWR